MEFDKLLKDNINKYFSKFKKTTNYDDKYDVNILLKGLKDNRAS